LEALQAEEKALHEGAMIALFVPPDEAARLVQDHPSALPAEELHLTLAFLGKTADLGERTRKTVQTILEQSARALPPIAGHVGGKGQFDEVGEGGENAYFATFDAPLLSAFREVLAGELRGAGVPISTDHGFTPHITLFYAADGETPDTPNLEFTFDQMTLAWGDEHEHYPLRGKETALKALSASANAVRLVRPLSARMRQRHAIAQKAGADEIEHQDLGSVVLQAEGHTFTGLASITTYKTRSTGNVWYRYDVEFDPPIPIEGKGDNSWDIGENSVYSISVPLGSPDPEDVEVAKLRVMAGIPLDRLIADEKGGPGSGYRGHAGRPGHQGGSAPRGAAEAGTGTGPTFSILEPGQRVDDAQIADWEGKRHGAAKNALREYNTTVAYTLLLAKQGDETVGIATVRGHRGLPTLALAMKGEKGPFAEVSWLATKRAGYGRQMMDRIAAYAMERGHGVSLGAAESAKGFYRKIGMNEAAPGTGVFYWTPQDLRERYGSKALEDDQEPEDGVFTTGPLQEQEKPEAEKADPSGAPLLAHLGRAELEGLLSLLQGIEDSTAARARDFVSSALANQPDRPVEGGVQGEKGTSERQN